MVVDRIPPNSMANRNSIHKDDVLQGFAALGLRKGDALLFHSSLKRFGFVEGGAETVIDGALDAVGATDAFESFPHGEPIEMNEENIVRYSRDDLPIDSRTDWGRVKGLSEADLNAAALSDPDAPPFMSGEDWKKTDMLAQIPIDRETFEYCRKHGGGIQTVIKNAVREYMDAHPLN